jgi:hypothetical protein
MKSRISYFNGTFRAEVQFSNVMLFVQRIILIFSYPHASALILLAFTATFASKFNKPKIHQLFLV